MSTLRNVRWTFSATVLKRALVIVLFLYIARMIDSEALGLFGTYTRLITLLTTLAVFSLDAFYIVEKEPVKAFPLFISLPLILGLALTILLPILAGPIAGLYKTPELKSLILYTFPILMVYVLRQVLKVSLKKEFRFKETSLFETANVLLYCLATVLFLFYRHSIWIVLIAFFCGDILEMLLVLFSKGSKFPSKVANALLRTSAHEKVDRFKQNAGFLTTTTAMHLMGAFVGIGPIFLLGIAFPEHGIEYTGIYFLAWNVVSLPVTLMTESALQVFFPSFARMNQADMQRNIQRFLFFTLSTLWPLVLFYILLASKLVPMALGGEWTKTSGLMIIMGLSALTTLLMNPLSSIPLVFRKPQIELFWRILSLILTSAGLFIGSHFGFYYSIAGFVVAKAFTHILFLGIIFRMVRLDMTMLLRKTGFILILIAMLAAAMVFSYYQSRWIGIGIASGAVVLYFFIANLASRDVLFSEIGNLIRLKLERAEGR